MSTGPLAATASSSVGKAGTPEDVPVVRVDRHALVALVEQVAHDPVRRPARVGRRADDRDPAGRRRTSRAIPRRRARDRAAALLEVEDRPSAPRSSALTADAAQVRALALVRLAVRGRRRRSGRPTPARTTIVTMYGRAPKNSGGIARRTSPSWPVGGVRLIAIRERLDGRRTGAPPRTPRSASSARR